MNPEEIASKEFPVVMRGYVREEVHAFLASVAGQLAERDARIAALESQLAGSRQPSAATAAKPVLDRTELLRHLGEEAASILTCADATAERMKAQAGVAAERVRTDLTEIGSGLVDVHQLLGELVALVQSLTEESALLAPTPATEVSLLDTATTVSVVDAPVANDEVRTVLGEVLGLDGEEDEVRLPKEGQVPG
ncbi:MAG: DivIVA domain-containing protein [Actinomycetota bacterium]|nr:DivIVA domain-containing protein [Actinomycetota bacterium]